MTLGCEGGREEAEKEDKEERESERDKEKETERDLQYCEIND